jgi:DNA-binding transcriptional MerR regulator
MYTIGEFSIMSGLPKKTLRYYDEIDLLNPISINQDNGYRLYAKEQLNQVNYIVSYKKLGISLNKIKGILNSHSRKDIKIILEEKLIAIDEQIEQLNGQKNAIRKELLAEPKSTLISKKFDLSQCTFPSGHIYEVHQQDEDKGMQEIIGELYYDISQLPIELKSKHFIRKRLTDIDEEETSVFAYVNNVPKIEGVLFQEEVKAILIPRIPLKNKNEAYTYMIDYAKANNRIMNMFIEEYELVNGKMFLSIYGL